MEKEFNKKQFGFGNKIATWPGSELLNKIDYNSIPKVLKDLNIDIPKQLFDENIENRIDEFVTPEESLLSNIDKILEGSFMTTLTLTDSSFRYLQKDGIPQYLLERLKNLRNQTLSKYTFWKVVQKQIDPENVEPYKKLILKYASIKKAPAIEHKEEILQLLAKQRQGRRFVILGKPGAGKTTFLKYLALHAFDSKMKVKRIPVFIGLKDFSESEKSLLDFVVSELDGHNFPEIIPSIIGFLNEGKFLLLFDGLDEVPKKYEDFVVKQLKFFSNKYRNNQFIVSCRTPAYRYWFDSFTDIEIADFNESQIKEFIENWFGNDSEKAVLCWKKLNENERIKELASIPLLLTLICIAFNGLGDFPRNRSELYEEALETLLKTWDESRKINRDQIYKQLSLKCKKDMLNKIGVDTFTNDEYFLPQRTLEKYIANFLFNRIKYRNDESLELDSEAVLQAIETQHGIFVQRAKGIYSFSHLTFQEYFTAKHIVDNAEKGSLVWLIKDKINNEKWREVFLLVAGLLYKSDNFLIEIKKAIDQTLCTESLNRFLKMVYKVPEIKSHYPPVVNRALAIRYVIEKAK